MAIRTKKWRSKKMWSVHDHPSQINAVRNLTLWTIAVFSMLRTEA